jgi:hypothetical protein
MTNDEEDSMSELYQSLSHSKWDCKYHVVFVIRCEKVGRNRGDCCILFEAGRPKWKFRIIGTLGDKMEIPAQTIRAIQQ